MHDYGQAVYQGLRPHPESECAKQGIYPMKRAGEKGEGKWQRISWDEALDTIANKLKYYKKSTGRFRSVTSGKALC